MTQDNKAQSFSEAEEADGLVHVPEGQLVEVGNAVADWLEQNMRANAVGLTPEERASNPLCPGCFYAVLMNALNELAERNDISSIALGRALVNDGNELIARFNPLAAFFDTLRGDDGTLN